MSDTQITIYQWASFDPTLTIRDADENPIDLTGFEVIGEIRRHYKDAAPAAVFSIEPTGDPGEVQVLLTGEQSGALTSLSRTIPTYVYDFVLRRISDDWRLRLMWGDVLLVPGVTR